MNFPQPPLIWVIVLFLTASIAGAKGESRAGGFRFASVTPQASRADLDRQVAATFAPIFYQALGDKPRSDYITHFNFDNDWRGDNNWQNAANKKFPLKAYIYYSVAETASHIFIHYAVFHPRDYKGGERKGAILSEIIREGAKRGGKYESIGLAEEPALAHENDLEGCLVVVEKSGKEPETWRTAYVETLHHDSFSSYIAGDAKDNPVEVEGQRALLYIEPKGHGIEALDGERKKIEKKRYLIYKYAGVAEDPERSKEGSVGYELVPLQTTLWATAQIKNSSTNKSLVNSTYGATQKYDPIELALVQPDGRVVSRKFDVGTIGSAFLGRVGGQNKARPPWAWFDRSDRDVPPGQWFFDPATTIKRSFKLEDTFSTAYIRLPFWAR